MFRKIKSYLPFIIFISYFLLSILFTYPLILNLNTSITGVLEGGIPAGDTSQFLWNFWWLKKSVFELHTSPFFTNYLASPIGSPIIYSTSLSFFSSLLSIPLQYFFTLIGCYNFLILLCFTLCGYFTYLLVKYLSQSGIAGFIAGLIFATYSYFPSHYEHLNLLSAQWIPLTFLFLFKTADTKKMRYAVLSALFFVINALSEWYYLLMMGLFLAVFIFYKLIQSRTDRQKSIDKKLMPIYVFVLLLLFILIQIDINYRFWILRLISLYSAITLILIIKEKNIRKDLINIMIFLVLVGFLLSPFALMHLSQSKQDDIIQIDMTSKAFYSAEILSYVVHKSPFKFDNDNFYRLRTDSEFRIFLGYVVILLLIISLIFGKKGRFWYFPAIFFFIMSLGPVFKFNGLIETSVLPNQVIMMPASIFEKFPLYDAIRVHARFGVFVMLSVSVFIGQNIGCIMSVFKNKKVQYSIYGLIIILIIAEKINVPVKLNKVDTPLIYKEIAEDKNNFSILNIPFEYKQSYIYAQILHNHPIMNIFVPRRPPKEVEDYFRESILLSEFGRDLNANISEEKINIMKEEIKKSGLKYIIIHKKYTEKNKFIGIKNILTNSLKFQLYYEDAAILIYQISQGL